MDQRRVQQQKNYDQEFRQAIRASPISEITLPIWELAKSCHVMPVGRPPLNRRELLHYLAVIADFKIATQYKTPTYKTLEALATSAASWNWDSNAHREMLLLSNATRLPFPPTGDELLKIGRTAAHRPRHHRRTLGNDSSSPTTLTQRYGGRYHEVGGPPTGMRWTPKPTPARAQTDAPGTGRRRCGANARTATSTIGGPPTSGAVAPPSPGPASSQRSADHEHAWLTETHSAEQISEDGAQQSDEEKSEDSYYEPDNYHTDGSGYDSDMYKKCWEDDF